jgi:4-hydroxybutyrate CoA-transferase
MSWQKHYKSRLVSASQAVSHITSGMKLSTGHACAAPTKLVDALMERKDELSGVQITHMVPLTPAPYCEEPHCRSFRHVSVFSGGSTRGAINEGRADFIPRLFRRIPSLFTETFPLDAALIKLSPPDKHGYMSLGISVDYSKEAVRVAPLVIAEISSHVPRTLGDSFVHVSEVDYFVETNEPLVELPPPVLTEVEMGIGKNVASLIKDGDCLQLGIGAIPDAVLRFLTEKNDMGIHSEMISDGVMGLMKAGNINNSRKQLLPGKCVIGFAMGTNEFYTWLDDNPATEFHPITFVNDPLVIRQNDNVVSVNSAITVDLLGQVAADMMGPKQFSAVGGQTDFVLGAMMSKNGRSIIALPATAAKGKVSRIAVALERGQAVTTTRNDVQYVVTEYGVALLRGMTMRQRAAALINVAAPQFRDQLRQECVELYGWAPEK